MTTIDITNMSDEELADLLGAPEHCWTWVDIPGEYHHSKDRAEDMMRTARDRWSTRGRNPVAAGKPLRVQRFKMLGGYVEYRVQFRKFVGDLV